MYNVNLMVSFVNMAYIMLRVLARRISQKKKRHNTQYFYIQRLYCRSLKSYLNYIRKYLCRSENLGKSSSGSTAEAKQSLQMHPRVLLQIRVY